MKIKLIPENWEFDLNDEDERMAILRCLKATDMAIVLFQIKYNLRKKCYNDPASKDGDFSDGVDTAFNLIHNLFEKYNIDINEIID